MIDLDRILAAVTITPVDHLRSNGFSLSLNDRGALVVAPAARLDDATRAYIRQHLDEIKSALSAEESQYWAAYQRGAEIAAAADVAQACVVGATKTESEAHSALRQTREQLTQLRTDPSRHGARMTRREIEAEIAAEERNERRALIFLKAIRTHVARHQADLQRLMGQCALETRTLNAFTDQYEAPSLDDVRAFAEATPGAMKEAAGNRSGQIPAGDVRLTANIRGDLHLKLKIRAAEQRTTVGELIEQWIESWR